MAVTRRQFVHASSVGAVGAALSLSNVGAETREVGAASAASTGGATKRLPFAIDMAGFRAQIDTRFLLRSAAGGVSTMMLVRVEDLVTPEEQCRAGCGEERFSLMFHAPCDCPLVQGTHDVEHPALGTFPLFIVPMRSRDPRRPAYEATFNRIVRADLGL